MIIIFSSYSSSLEPRDVISKLEAAQQNIVDFLVF